jgi:hypothetical protein
MPRFAYYFVCKNPDCREPTELPLAIREEIQSRQTLLSTGTISQALLCPRCKHVFEYILEDIQPRPAPNQDLYSVPPAMSVRKIEIECDGKDCGIPISVIAPWIFGLQPDKRWPSDNEVATWKPHDLKCPNGHPAKLPLTLKKENS